MQGRPRMGAWIEIIEKNITAADLAGRPRMGAWIEIIKDSGFI